MDMVSDFRVSKNPYHFTRMRKENAAMSNHCE